MFRLFIKTQLNGRERETFFIIFINFWYEEKGAHLKTCSAVIWNENKLSTQLNTYKLFSLEQALLICLMLLSLYMQLLNLSGNYDAKRKVSQSLPV